MGSPFQKAKDYLKAKGYAWRSYRNMHPQDRGLSRINLLKEFPAFRPNMNGDYDDKALILSQCIKNLSPFLSHLALSAGSPKCALIEAVDLPQDDESRASARKLQQLFDLHGSDKGTDHGYHWLYGYILRDCPSIDKILEIGLGTNNETLPCNMGESGKPGASLRAFRDFCPNALIYGGDIDSTILFQEDRIQTSVVDQTSPAAFENLFEEFPGPFDLVIDDGLHSLDANILTLSYGLQRITPGGWIVIEDILEMAVPIWQFVAGILPAEKYQTFLIKAEKGILFAVHHLRTTPDS